MENKRIAYGVQQFDLNVLAETQDRNTNSTGFTDQCFMG